MRVHHRLLALVVCCVCASLSAQTKLPPTSRSVFKCAVDGKVTYSDEPCLGAEKINAEPTRGLNQFTGNVKRGPDVQREISREAFADSIRPLTGMDAGQLSIEGRRQQLPVDTRKQCAKLDQDVARGEAQEQSKAANDRSQVQHELFVNRVQFKKLGC